MGAINYGYNNHFNGFQLGYNLNCEYYTKDKSILQLKDTIKKERENIKKEFTYYTLNRSGLSWWELSR